jgi:hypothetical protein
MDSDAALDLFGRLAVWSRGKQRAPHKPLLVLYALGRWVRGDQGGIPFTGVARDLTALLRDFGPPRQGAGRIAMRAAAAVGVALAAVLAVLQEQVVPCQVGCGLLEAEPQVEVRRRRSSWYLGCRSS